MWFVCVVVVLDYCEFVGICVCWYVGFCYLYVGVGVVVVVFFDDVDCWFLCVVVCCVFCDFGGVVVFVLDCGGGDVMKVVWLVFGMWCCECGVIVIEFVLMLLVFFLILYVIIMYGMIFVV